jgi:hypothetical protein
LKKTIAKVADNKWKRTYVKKQKSELWEKQQSKTELKKAGTRRRNGSTAGPVQVLEQCSTLLIRISLLVRI